MELIDALHQVVGQTMKAAQPADLTVGTVVAVDPLEISINSQMAPLRASVLYLTAAVVERKLSPLQHRHEDGDDRQTTEALTDVICTEQGNPLPRAADGSILLNRGLTVGDKVLLLRVQRGQKFVVLSRIF